MFKLEQLPFYWRLNDYMNPEANPVGDRYPFFLGYNEELGLLQESLSDELKEALVTIYKEEHNIGYHQEVNTLARPYVADLLRYISEQLDIYFARKVSVLEIGCGGCLVLEHLKSAGHHVVGLDPSPFAVNEGAKRDIEVVNDFFPSARLIRKFDVIFHADVLEHTFEPLGFLEEQYKSLEDDGVLIVSVPDNTKNIALGDFSMLMHQHVNYFDERSLKNILHRAGFSHVEVERARYGGSLYGLARKSSQPCAAAIVPVGGCAEFFELAKDNASKFAGWFAEYKDKDVAFYCPLRILPYLALIPGVDKQGVRLIDDTPHWHNCFFDGEKIKIENKFDFMKDPAEVVFIASLTFAETIKKNLLGLGYQGKIVTLGEFIGE